MIRRKPQLRMAVLATYCLFSILIASLTHVQLEAVSAQIPQREGFSTIGWNGEYFLIGTYEGHLVKLDDRGFELAANLGERINELTWSGGFWLIGGQGMLLKYEGGFTNLSSDYDVQDIWCNEEYCLIYAYLLSQPGNTKLLKYDGSILADLTGGIAKGKKSWVGNMAWNGEYWLIHLTVADDRRATSTVLLRYDGASFREVLDSTYSVKRAFAWNGEYWLLTGSRWINKTTGPEPRLLKYDGKNFTEADFPITVFEKFDREHTVSLEPYIVSGAFYAFPSMIAWNGEYWLMETGFSLIKYDGKNFSVERYRTGVYTPYRVKKMEWNGEYWLILHLLAGTEGSAVAKYNGTDREALLYKFRLSTYRQWPPVGDVEWGRGYWLIGTYRFVRPEQRDWVQDYMKPSLLKYDGTAFTDLTSEFSKAVEKQPNGKAICGPTVLLLLALLPVLAYGGLRRR